MMMVTIACAAPQCEDIFSLISISASVQARRRHAIDDTDDVAINFYHFINGGYAHVGGEIMASSRRLPLLGDIEKSLTVSAMRELAS